MNDAYIHTLCMNIRAMGEAALSGAAVSNHIEGEVWEDGEIRQNRYAPLDCDRFNVV
jgi:hypothetical protein